MTIGDQIQKPEESKGKRALNWVLWWQTDPVEIDEQARLYDTIGFRGSWRGWAALCLAFSGSVTLAIVALSTGGAFSPDYIDVAVMAVLGVFIFLGHRWAMIGAMIVWTIEKFFIIAMNPYMAVTSLIWWALYMHVFYSAFRVEQRRRSAAVVEPAIFD